MKGKDKNGKKQKQPEQICEVCKFKIMPGQAFEKLQCSGCFLIVHKYCYAPEFKQGKNNKFKCDLCKKRSSKGRNKEETNVNCSFCGVKQGLLKEISNGQWMHVYCALTSPKVTLIDYQNLRFSIEASPVIKKGAKIKCSTCGKMYAQPCKIKDCKQRQHLNCLLQNNLLIDKMTSQIYGGINTLGLLDRNQGSLLFKLKQQKQYKHFHGLTLVDDEGREPRFIVCQTHNESTSFVWCYCSQNLKNGGNQIQCESCGRWYHQKCNYYSDDNKVCKPCKDNNIYIKNMSLAELVFEAIKVQTTNKWDKTHIKFLDHLALKYSLEIENKIKVQDNRLTIQRYFLRRSLSKFDKETRDQTEEGRILQILYYLLKKQIKVQSQITIQDIEYMLRDNTSSSDKLHLKFAQQKPQKAFKLFLQSKLKKLKKDDIREIKTKLNNLEKQLVNNHITQKQIVSFLYPVLKLVSNSQTWSTSAKKNHQNNVNYQILEFLIGSQLSKTQLEDVLRGIKILIRARNNRQINEDDYFSITFQLYRELGQHKAKALKSIHMKLLKGVNHRKLYQKRRQILSNIQNKYTQASFEEKMTLRSKANSNGILIPRQSKAFEYEAESIEFQIAKKLFIKKYNSPNLSDLGQALQSLQQLLATNRKLGIMEDQQRKSFQALYLKYKFYNGVFTYVNQLRKKIAYNEMRMGVLQQAYSSQSQNKDINDPKSLLKLQKELYSALNDWPTSFESILLGLQYLAQVSLKQISFTQHQCQIIIAFFEKLLGEINKMMHQGVRILKPQLLKDIVLIARYLKIEEKCEFYLKIDNFYNQWKDKLQKNFLDIEKVLECPERTKDLINVIDQKLSQINFQNNVLDLSSEIRKLKIMRSWAIFSQKLLVPQKKATLTAIQNARTLMEKIYYPKNSVRAQIQKLDLQSKTLNRKIGRFLQKQKFSDMDYHQEIKFIQAKMTLKEAYQLQKDLQNSGLDVEIQLNQLKEQLNNSKYFPADIVRFCQESKKSQILADLRRKVMEGPFLVCSLKEYQILLSAFYSRKCQEFQGPITKRQYFRLLSHGGMSALQLYNKTQPLYKMYRDIDTAQKEVLLVKPRAQFLLNHDIKKIKADLQEDPTQFSRIEKYYLLANKYRQRFASLKEERADIQRYNALQSDLNKLPVNCRDISNEISRMKRELQDYSNKIRIYLFDQHEIVHMQYCSPFYTQFLNKYQRSGIRNETMNKFEQIVTKAKQITEVLNNLTFTNYKMFSVLCNSSVQLEKNDEIYAKRMVAFQQIYQTYIINPQPLIEVGLTLLAEGGFLVRRPKTAQFMLSLLINVKDKLLKSEQKISRQQINNQNGDEDQYSQDQDLQNSDEQGYDEENLESQNMEEDSNDIQNIDLEDYDQEEYQLDSGSGEEEELRQDASKVKNEKSKKRPRPNEYVISDSEQ